MPGGQPLEHRARLQDLDGFLRLHEPHSRAAVALVLDQPLVLEPGERGAYGGAPHAQHLREIGLDQTLARLKTAGDDRFAQSVFRAAVGRIVNNLVNHDRE